MHAHCVRWQSLKRDDCSAAIRNPLATSMMCIYTGAGSVTASRAGREAMRYHLPHPANRRSDTMNEQRAKQFLNDVRLPLLTLHKAILDHERASYEREAGPVTPAAFLQVLINGTAFRWLMPLSTVIANVDEALDAKNATADDRIGAAEGVLALFDGGMPKTAFLERYQALLQASPDVLHLHAQLVPILQGVKGE
jgi:hypothetical protein